MLLIFPSPIRWSLLKWTVFLILVILSLKVSSVMYGCWVKRLLQISELQLASLRSQLLSLRKFRGLLGCLLRSCNCDQSASEGWAAHPWGDQLLSWYVVGTVLACCMLLAESFIPVPFLPCSGFGCQVLVKVLKVLGRDALCLDPACLLAQRGWTWRLQCVVADVGPNFAWGALLNSQGTAGTRPTSISPNSLTAGPGGECFIWKGKTTNRRRWFHPHVNARSAWSIIYFCLR